MADGPDLEQQASSERSRAYLGRAKILIHRLVFEADKSCEVRPLDGKNVSRLHRIFELEGCSRLDPDNHVPTLIKRKVLADALGNGGSLDVSLGGCGEPSLLEVEEPLVCLHGRHRLAAAKQYFFQPEQKWWIVDLYLDGMRADFSSRNAVSLLTPSQDLNPSVITALKEAYSNSRNFCDGDIFRNLRYCQLRKDKAGAGKWMARLSQSKQADIAQLQNMAKKNPEMAALQDALDTLLPFMGLWSPVQIGIFHRLLTLRCPEVTTAHMMPTLLKFC